MIAFRQVDARYPFLWDDASQPAGRWHAEGEGPALTVAPDYKRLLEQHALNHFTVPELAAGKGAVPEAEQHERVGRLLLKWGVVRHWTGEDTARVSRFQSFQDFASPISFSTL